MAEGKETRLALYRKYRPTKLSEVIGQPQVTDILEAAAKRDQFAQSYLFTGQRGTGKTTVARILAHLINHLDYTDNLHSDNVDIIEIDAASNNGVDDVRAIRDSVRLAPMQCAHKVYIIDEFHMLSKPAFNALLKTIEEPPEYVTFILATTELQKVPATILSRVQRFHFRPVAEDVLCQHLANICQAEHIQAEDEALRLIARAGGGSVRDSITLLDQLSGSGNITAQGVIEILGLIPDSQLDDLLASAQRGDAGQIASLAGSMLQTGTSASALAEQLIRHILRQTATSKNLYRLVDQLLDVRSAAIPEAKLLAVLIGFSGPGAATTVAAPHQPATQSGKTVVETKSAAATRSAPAPLAAPAGTKLPEPTPAALQHIEALVYAEKKTQKDSTADSSEAKQPIDNFVWADLLNQVASDDHPSTRSLLEQCDYRYDKGSNTLTLYFAKKFFRTKAHSQGFNTALLEALAKLYGSQPTIVISDSSAPANSGVAAVLNAIGGEVTKVDDAAQ